MTINNNKKEILLLINIINVHIKRKILTQTITINLA